LRSSVVATIAIGFLAACSQSQDFSTVLASAGAPNGTSAGTGTGVPTPEPAPAAPVCASGQCKPVVLADGWGIDAETSDPNSQGTFAITTDDGFVYFMTTWSEIIRVPRAPGGKAEKLTDTDSGPFLLKRFGDFLYFSSVPNRQIQRMPKTGGAIEDVTPPSTDWQKDIQDFATEGTTLTWYDAQTVHRCDAIPCGQIRDYTLTDPKGFPGAIGVGFGHLLVAVWEEDAGNAGLAIEALDEGSGVQTLPLDYRKLLLEADPKNPGLTAVFGAASNTIVRADYPGVIPAQVLASGPEIDDFPAGLAVDATYLYWVNRGTICIPGEVDCTASGGSVMRARKDGAAKAEVVLDGQPQLRDLALTADTLYMTTGDGKVLALAKPAETPLH
jgi:hypothetical protein